MTIQSRRLEWHLTGLGCVRLDASAFGIKTFYRITRSPGNWTLTLPGETDYIHKEGFQTQAVAKRAAQDDCDRRLREQMP